nr:hypothetical protein BaRGS_006669 [Batillaria attramentaria]
MLLFVGPPDAHMGVSYRDKICTESSLSAVAARPNGNTAIALVHELSHSLNAAHDGAEDNVCSNSSKFIMASVGPRNVGESYRFSLCSIGYIKNKLLSLYSDPGGNCLAADKTRTVPVVAEPLGKLYTPDEICQMNVARDSYLCRDMNT